MDGGLYCFAWNAAELGEDGARAFVARAKSLGLSALYMAATYHAGWLLRPHSSGARAYMTHDGAAYFQPDMELYGAIKPRPAPFVVERDWMREVRAACAREGLEFWAWTIGAHNTPLGLDNWGACVRNAFGDALPHALCPAHPEVRRYLIGLCEDLARNVGVTGLMLESFGYGGWKHGHHHERELTGLSGWESQLMGLCFAPDTKDAARARRVDADAVHAGVRALLEGAMDAAPDRPAGHPAAMDEAQERVPGLGEYMDARRAIERDLFRAIRAAVPAETRFWRRYDAEMEDVTPPQTTVSAANIYGQDEGKARETLAKARAELPDAYELHAGMRLGLGLPGSEAEFQSIARAAREAGAARLVFYNASESPRRMIEWIPAALQSANAE